MDEKQPVQAVSIPSSGSLIHVLLACAHIHILLYSLTHMDMYRQRSLVINGMNAIG